MKIVDVVFDIPIDKPFGYLPGNFEDGICPGKRVRVSFGRQKKTGITVSLSENEKAFQEECKNILKVYDPFPIITDNLFSAADFLSHKYFSSLGQALFSMVGTLPFKYDAGCFEKQAKDSSACRAFKKHYILLDREDLRFAYIEKILAGISEGSAAVLFPEVLQAESFYGQIKSRYKEKALIFHGEMSGKDKMSAWLKMLSGQNMILAGTRLAVFAPLNDIKVFIINNEHDFSFREQQTPKYDAFEVANFRARSLNASLVILDTCFSVRQHFFISREGAEVENTESPGEEHNLYIIPATKKKSDKRLPFLALNTVSLLEETLLKGGRAAVIHNNRGTSKLLMCEKCGGKFSCAVCDSALVLSEDGKNLLCRFCKTVLPFEKKCPSCGSKKVSVRLYGIEKMFKTLKEVYPSVKIAKVSAATAKDTEEDFSILIGTSAIKRYIQKYPFGLIVFVSGESFLNIPDYRSEEKFFVLANEISALAEKGKCKIIIQTKNPALEIYKALRENNRGLFYKKELLIREQLGYPPCSEIIKVELKNKARHILDGKKDFLTEYFSVKNIDILYAGPSFPPVKKGKSRWKYLLRPGDDFDRDEFKKMMHEIGAAVEADPEQI